MQTFLPYPDYARSARVLDNKRLGKQRVESKQILQVLQIGPYQIADKIINGEPASWKSAKEAEYLAAPKNHRRKTPWYNHPAAKMWRGYEYALCDYSYIVCAEWIDRGCEDSLLNWFHEKMRAFEPKTPIWMGNEQFHLSHQSNLVRKDPDYYTRHFPGVPSDLPYLWPDP